MKNINRIIILLVGMIMVGCGSNGAANTNGNGVNIKQEEKEYDVQIEASEQTNDETNPNADFGNSSWGDNIEDVKKSEKLAITENGDDYLVYGDEEISNIDMITMYSFKNGKLNCGVYTSNEKHTSENLYIEDYDNLKKSLIDKYGEPEVDDMLWYNDLYKDSPNDYGFAVSLGDLCYLTEWENDNTRIRLGLYGDNYDISLVITYEDTENLNEKNDSGL